MHVLISMSSFTSIASEYIHNDGYIMQVYMWEDMGREKYLFICKESKDGYQEE